ncbi:MAG: SemiSWEET transporter [Candidatus Omnitrophota bacterium]
MQKIHISTIGLIAGVCTTISFIPQMVKILRTKHVRDLSSSMYIILTVGITLWLIYGIFLGELPIILANSVTLCFCVFVLVSKIRYGRKQDPPK